MALLDSSFLVRVGLIRFRYLERVEEGQRNMGLTTLRDAIDMLLYYSLFFLLPRQSSKDIVL